MALPAFAVQQVLLDPTRPSQSTSITSYGLGAEQVSPQRLQLESIFTGKNKKSAVISGKVLRIGDEINGMKLVSIESNRVMLQNQHENLTLSLYKYDIKK